MNTSNGFIGQQNEPEIAPSFLFGERGNKRKTLGLNSRPSVFGSPGILKKDLSGGMSPGKNVRWSSELIQEQGFPAKFVNAPLTSSVYSPSSFNAPPSSGSVSNVPISKGPPLASLDSTTLEPPQKLSRPDVALERKEEAMNAINNSLNAFNKVMDSSDYWVTVYGFAPEDRDIILNVFSRHGNIVSHNIPRLGNWIHIRYSSVLHAQQALKRDGNVLNDRLMVGVVKCTDKDVVSDTKLNPLNSSVNNMIDATFGSPVMQSTFRHAIEEERSNGAHNNLSFADATSFTKSRVSALSRNGMRSLRVNENDVSLNTSVKKDESFLGKVWNFIAPHELLNKETMDEGHIILIDGDSDVLHCGFNFALSEGGKRYPSSEHYAHAMLLTSLNLEEGLILELLATQSNTVAKKARELLRENMPSGYSMTSLQQYLVSGRQSFTMQGLRLRAEQDRRFRQALIETKNALLVVCDRNDPDLGVGMSVENFTDFMKTKSANVDMLSQWMQDNSKRPPELGQNQLGFFLMWIRYELREKQTVKWLTNAEIELDGLNVDGDGSKLKISASNLVISLEGIFSPLSNYFVMPLEMKGEVYRSVEHYAYQRLFEALKLDDSEIMRLRTTVKPKDLSTVAKRIIRRLKIDISEFTHKKTKLDRWRQSAMKHKISKNEFLQQLLLSTGFAILLEYTEADDYRWVSNVDEFELQHLLTKRYVTPSDIIEWMCERKEPPKVLSHLVSNRSGIFLMELRRKFATGNSNRIPLVSPLKSNVILSAVSNHMICLTPESVLHPLYPAEIRIEEKNLSFPSPIHYVAKKACEFFELDAETEKFLLTLPDTLECWSYLHTILDERMLPLEKVQRWYMDERQIAIKDAMRLQFNQHQPLLRVLLDTEDSLLVCCSRFSSSEAELSSGMRERDLRLWCSQTRLSTKQLIELFLRPMAFRPAFVGGNRIGLMLMELRREFILQAVIPHLLPELSMPADAILGTESPLENYVPHVDFQIFDDTNFLALWANPLILITKQDPQDSELDQAARTVKAKPPLLALDNVGVDDIINDQYTMQRYDFYNKMFASQNVELMRGVFAKNVLSLRAGIMRDLRSQRILNFWSHHTGNVQAHRRVIEARGQSQPFMSQPPMNRIINPWANNQGPILDAMPDNQDRQPLLGKHVTDMNTGSPYDNRRDDQRRQDRRDNDRRGNDYNDRWGVPSRDRNQNRKRDISPDRTRRNDNHRQRNKQNQQRNVQNQILPRSPVEQEKPPEQKVLAPPAAKKPKRVVNEEDLSEGEIIDSDDE
ncbi:NADAR domain-containing protein [Aphelenchoides bicaudatus]|nr:NADAR domain-containing protein [Aphelenchoides bicaudatus]